MIIKINLAPEFQQQQDFKKFAPAVLSSVAVIAIAYYLPTIYADSINGDAQEITRKTSEKKQQIAALQADLNKAKAMQAMVGDIEARKGAIQNLANGRKQPVAVLDKLQELHLERMWITSMEFKQNTMSIKGWATDHNVISEYVRRLKTANNTDDISSIDLKSFKPTFPESNDAKNSQNDKKEKTLVNTPLVTNINEKNTTRVSLSNVHFTNIILKESITKEAVEAANMPIQNFELQLNPNIELR